MVTYLIFIVIGILYGGFGTLLFFRFDKKWKQITTGITCFLTSTGTGFAASSYFQIPVKNRPACFLLMQIAAIASVCCAFAMLAKLLQSDDSKYPMRKLDIILGYDKCLEQYYEQRKQQASAFCVEEERKELSLREDRLRTEEDLFREQIEGGISIQLPQNQNIAITKHFLGKLPVYIDHLYAFRSNINDLTEQLLQDIGQTDPDRNAELLKGYFAGIGMYVSNDLFGIPENSNEVRTHFRIYKDGRYTQYTIIEGSKMSAAKIHDIPGNANSLIKLSFELRTSLIASLNSEYVYNVNTPWEDFMTITYYDIVVDGNPFLSMGISIKNREQFFDLLSFLNWYKIETCLQNYINRVNSVCDIVKTLGK